MTDVIIMERAVKEQSTSVFTKENLSNLPQLSLSISLSPVTSKPPRRTKKGIGYTKC